MILVFWSTPGSPTALRLYSIENLKFSFGTLPSQGLASNPFLKTRLLKTSHSVYLLKFELIIFQMYFWEKLGMHTYI